MSDAAQQQHALLWPLQLIYNSQDREATQVPMNRWMGEKEVAYTCTIWSRNAAHASILAWKIPCAEEPGRLQSIGSHRVRHDWSALACIACMEIKQIGWRIWSIIFIFVWWQMVIRLVMVIIIYDYISFSNSHSIFTENLVINNILQIRILPEHKFSHYNEVKLEGNTR